MEKKKRVYIAGPLFSEHERKFLEDMANNLASNVGLDPKRDIFLPHRDVGEIGIHGKGRKEIFSCDLKFLDNASIIVALLDGPDVDSGTAAELGYAFARNKEIFGILTDWRRWSKQEVKNLNNMIWGVCGEGKHIFKGVNDRFIRTVKEYLK